MYNVTIYTNIGICINNITYNHRNLYFELGQNNSLH